MATCSRRDGRPGRLRAAAGAAARRVAFQEQRDAYQEGNRGRVRGARLPEENLRDWNAAKDRFRELFARQLVPAIRQSIDRAQLAEQGATAAAEAAEVEALQVDGEPVQRYRSSTRPAGTTAGECLGAETRLRPCRRCP